MAETHPRGCVRCHGPEGRGRDADSSLTGANIQGKSADEIRVSIMALSIMWGIKLTDEELAQLEAYLARLAENA